MRERKQEGRGKRSLTRSSPPPRGSRKNAATTRTRGQDCRKRWKATPGCRNMSLSSSPSKAPARISSKDLDTEEEDDASALLPQLQNNDADPVSESGQGLSTAGWPHPQKRGPSALYSPPRSEPLVIVHWYDRDEGSIVAPSVVLFFKSHRSFLAGLALALSILVGFRSFLDRCKKHVRSSEARKANVKHQELISLRWPQEMASVVFPGAGFLSLISRICPLCHA